jgi:hypothetical protein
VVSGEAVETVEDLLAVDRVETVEDEGGCAVRVGIRSDPTIRVRLLSLAVGFFGCEFEALGTDAGGEFAGVFSCARSITSSQTVRARAVGRWAVWRVRTRARRRSIRPACIPLMTAGIRVRVSWASARSFSAARGVIRNAERISSAAPRSASAMSNPRST